MKKNTPTPGPGSLTKITCSEKTNSITESGNTNNKGKKDDSYSTYLGEKGYSIFKECLSVEEQHFIRTEL